MPGIDHPFIVEGSEDFAVVMRHVGELRTDTRSMTIKSTHPVVVIYTTNWLPTPANLTADHPGGNHIQHAAICLETCGYSDAVNNTNEPGWPPKAACLLYRSEAEY